MKPKTSKKNKKIKQKGGANVVSASISLVNSMKNLGNSIFTEIKAITNIGADLNNATTKNVPVNNINGPGEFKSPKL
jgi:hypothetical protein